MIQKLDPRLFESELDLAQRCGVAADIALDALHTADGVDRDPGFLGKLLLFPSDEGAGGAELAIEGETHKLNDTRHDPSVCQQDLGCNDLFIGYNNH